MTPRFVAGYAGRRTAKYGNRHVTVDGIKFPSEKSARRYKDLKLLLHADRIRNLRLEVPYKLMVNGSPVCMYRADFVYDEYTGRWAEVVEDVKGVRTPVYLLKKKLMRAILGIEIRET
jgi:hypothetical protein